MRVVWKQPTCCPLGVDALITVSKRQLTPPRARERDEFTDFVLVCGPERFPVHKVIVCSQSKVFHAACSKPFKEAASGVYEIIQQSPVMVRRMVEYFYISNYTDCNEATLDPSKEKLERSGEEGLTALCIHARMFALADIYQVDRLQSLAATKYGKALEKRSNLQDLLDSIPDVCQLTPCSVRALRDKAVVALRVELGQATRLHQFTVASPTAFGDNTGGAADSLMAVYDEVATETPEFLKDLLSSYIRIPLLGQCYNCGPKQPQPAESLQMKCLTRAYLHIITLYFTIYILKRAKIRIFICMFYLLHNTTVRAGLYATLVTLTTFYLYNFLLIFNCVGKIMKSKRPLSSAISQPFPFESTGCGVNCGVLTTTRLLCESRLFTPELPGKPVGVINIGGSWVRALLFSSCASGPYPIMLRSASAELVELFALFEGRSSDRGVSATSCSAYGLCPLNLEPFARRLSAGTF
ncbi:hypothetical protein GGTG_06814 [Gaeumannomyces tritici R3-111a-1]|uniref:BTB domain-containing protein n=1 Tax=Gaeumannomyces tritici (strain R3-111a-1) TaxID=644352 RepID=J3NZW7_GAET3|nr:hypothetical protein GGTG_06814 [Gaeumannomyces tritici R3-111a-1]EJT76900.1 hypothetical protein GGTG_06814 [Gaeumannomyces tritici R3-111a-1]